MAESITWAVLLARWTEFAKSAVALPTSGSGGRWRESVASIIGLQAIALALRDLDEHDLGDGRALAIDTASVGLDSHARDLAEVWADEPWPEELHELIEDARLALQGARAAGLEWCVDDGPASLEHPAELAALLEAMGFTGDLYLAAPGVAMSASSPCAFLGVPGGSVPDAGFLEAMAAFLSANGLAAEPARCGPPRQVYRQFDFAQGGVVRDLVAPMLGDPRPGQPLLVPVVLSGETQAVALPQRRGQPVDPPPLVFEDEPPAVEAGEA
ncbi:MAG: hypothetical protein ACFCBV_11395 [Phycisphaerales bacterium]|nr:hypothetical protein [Phycisphaerales bacterium]